MFATKFLEFRAHIYARLSLWHESEAVRFLSLWLALAPLKSGHRCNPNNRGGREKAPKSLNPLEIGSSV